MGFKGPWPSRKELRALLLFELEQVPHHFAGSWCASAAEASADACDRVLWYFGAEPLGFRGLLHVASRAVEGPVPSQLVESKVRRLGARGYGVRIWMPAPVMWGHLRSMSH